MSRHGNAPRCCCCRTQVGRRHASRCTSAAIPEQLASLFTHTGSKARQPSSLALPARRPTMRAAPKWKVEAALKQLLAQERTWQANELQRATRALQAGHPAEHLAGAAGARLEQNGTSWPERHLPGQAASRACSRLEQNGTSRACSRLPARLAASRPGIAAPSIRWTTSNILSRSSTPRRCWAISKKAEMGTLVVSYLDECGFTPTQPTTYSWSLPDERKKVRYEGALGRRVNTLVEGRRFARPVGRSTRLLSPLNCTSRCSSAR